MRKMTREDIDNMILESFENAGAEKILPQFSDTLDTILSCLKGNGIDPNGHDAFYTASYLSCIITAQTNAIHTIREVLYKIFCSNESETTKETTEVNENVLNQ